MPRKKSQNISNFLALTNTYENVTMMKVIVVELASTKKSLIDILFKRK